MDPYARTVRQRSAVIEEVEARSLVDASLAGDAEAFRRLCALLWPFWTQVARRTRALTLLGRGEDGVRDVATALAEKLARDDHRVLRQWREWSVRNEERSFADWMTIVTTNAIRSYVRKQTMAAQVVGDDESRNRVLRDFFAQIDVEQIGESPHMTPRQTARQIIEAARERLPARQLEALSLWLEGGELAEIAGELRLRGGGDEARRLVRAACATLRRTFVGE